MKITKILSLIIAVLSIMTITSFAKESEPFDESRTYVIAYYIDGTNGGRVEYDIKTIDEPYKIRTEIPSIDGYTFVGWGTYEYGMKIEYTPGEYYETNADLKLYAKFEKKTYLVTYDANGGIDAPVTQIKSHDVPLKLSKGIPTRKGYTFVGWGLNPGTTFVMYEPFDLYEDNKSRILYAIWSKDTYLIHFDANGGYEAPEDIIKEYGEEVVLPLKIPKREGYRFLGWGTSKDDINPAYEPYQRYVEEGNKTLYAIWERKEFYIDFDANGGTCSLSRLIKEKGVDIKIPNVIPQREGYDFCGWSKDKNAINGSIYPGEMYEEDNSIYLYAVWKIKRVSIIYHFGNDILKTSFNYGDVATINDAEPMELYKFIGYSSSPTIDITSQYLHSDNDLYFANDKCVITGDVDLYPRYECLHSIMYVEHVEVYSKLSHVLYINCGICNEFLMTEYRPHEGLEGYLKIDDKTHISSFFCDTCKYYESEIENHHMIKRIEDHYVMYHCSECSYSYVEYEIFTITFDLNGGTGDDIVLTKEYGTPLTIPDYIPSKPDCNFLGWSTNKNSKNPEYSPKDEIDIESDLTLYAIYVSNIKDDVYVERLTLSKTSVKPNDDILVSFVLGNNTLNDLNNVSYVVLFDGTAVYEGKIDILGLQSYTVSFYLNIGRDDGRFKIEVEINNNRAFKETDYSNNKQSAYITVERAKLITLTFIDPNHDYYDDTYVFSSFKVVNFGNANITQIDNLMAHLMVFDDIGNVIFDSKIEHIVVPENSENLIYFKYLIPKGTKSVRLVLSTNPYISSIEISRDVIKKEISNTKIPEYVDTGSYVAPIVNDVEKNKTSASFEVYEYSRGEYIKREYGIEFKALGNVIKTNNLDYDFIRSGYPISLDVIVSNSTPNKYSSFGDDMFTIPQRAYVLYPEFEYEYSCGLYTTLMHENNKLSLIPNENGDNAHFIPINAPDGKYSLILRLDDIWTPCGCVNLNLILEIDINGSIYDDWYRN